MVVDPRGRASATGALAGPSWFDPERELQSEVQLLERQITFADAGRFMNANRDLIIGTLHSPSVIEIWSRAVSMGYLGALQVLLRGAEDINSVSGPGHVVVNEGSQERPSVSEDTAGAEQGRY